MKTINVLKIVKMGKEHIKDIALLEKECFSNPWSENALKDELAKSNSCFLVSLENDKVSGYVGMNYVLDEGYITNIAVFKQYRGNGIATSLLENLILRCIDLKLSFLSLEVRVSNEKAISLYEKFEFKNLGIRKNFYTLPKEDAFIMTKYFK